MSVQNQNTKKYSGGTLHRTGSRRKSLIWLTIAGVVLIVAIVIMTAAFPVYQKEMNASRTRLIEGSTIIQTPCGPTEYTDIGEGYPVLIAHGNGGGYDQGVFLAETFLGNNYRWIVPSRFGYLRTPVPEDGSAEAQADAYASLLDMLHIQQVAIIGVSDGGPSTLQFALHHPERVTAVIMIAAKSQTPPRETFLQKIVFTTIFRSDFVYWAITKYLRSFLLSMFGVSSDVQAGFTPVDSAFVSDFISSMHPMSLRKAGIYNDREYLSAPSLDEYPLSSIAIPVLVIHAEDDALQPFTHGAHTAQNIPGARLVKFESGGHLLTGHIEEVKGELRRFIDKHAAAFAHAGPSETSGPSPEQGS